MTTELQPCPFCGHRPLSKPGFNADLWWISCTHCEAEMSFGTREGVVTRWNRRSPTTPTEGPAQTLTPEALYAVVPPSAAEYMSEPPAVMFSAQWQMGWDACRNRARLDLDEAIAKSKSASTLTDPEGAS